MNLGKYFIDFLDFIYFCTAPPASETRGSNFQGCDPGIEKVTEYQRGYYFYIEPNYSVWGLARQARRLARYFP